MGQTLSLRGFGEKHTKNQTAGDCPWTCCCFCEIYEYGQEKERHGVPYKRDGDDCGVIVWTARLLAEPGRCLSYRLRLREVFLLSCGTRMSKNTVKLMQRYRRKVSTQRCRCKRWSMRSVASRRVKAQDGPTNQPT